MTDSRLHVLLGTSSVSAAPLMRAAREFADVDPSGVSVTEDGNTISMWIAGFRVVIGNGLDRSVPYEGRIEEDVVNDVAGIVMRTADDLATRSDRDRDRTRASLTRAMTIRMIDERSVFAGDGYDDADGLAMHARTPWGPRRMRISRSTPTTMRSSGGYTRSSTLEEWPDEPVACVVAFDPQVGRGMITISAFRAHLDHPWSIDPVSAMRLIADDPDDGPEDRP